MEKHNDEIHPGDVIMFGGPHLITEVVPYEHPTLGEFVGIAKAADGWSITLDLPHNTVEVAS